jgi:phosphinothricin acetyltransferase
MDVRKAQLEDSKQIAEIYNYYVENSHSTFETEPLKIAEMNRRIAETIKNYPFFVCEESAEILGYAHAAQYKSRCAYKSSVEVSVYVKNGTNGKGIGTLLYEMLFAELFKTDVHAIIAGIALPNEASIKLPK